MRVARQAARSRRVVAEVAAHHHQPGLRAAASSSSSAAAPFSAQQRSAASAKAPSSVSTKDKLPFDAVSLAQIKMMEREGRYGAHNYSPIPVVIDRAQGVYVWDVDDNKYFDCLAAYSAVNQGHCHPKIVKALVDQASKITLMSRAFYTSALGEFEEYVCKLFGYDKVLPMNTGVEAFDTSVKIARKWAYDKKGVPKDQAIILAATGCFHGRSMTAVSASSDPDSYNGFGPLLPGIQKVTYGDLESLKKALENPNVAAYVLEPIQGEGGVLIPEDGYLREVSRLCKEANVLMIADEIQAGLGRAGKMLAVQWEDVRPDIVVLGKALSGGILPVSAVLADDRIMEVITPGIHGSTYGGNPLACHVARAALGVLVDEKLCENSEARGHQFRALLEPLVELPAVDEIRGRGLMNALVVKPAKGKTAWHACLALRDAGVLAKPTHSDIVRFTPPLCITETQMEEMGSKIVSTISQFSDELHT